MCTSSAIKAVADNRACEATEDTLTGSAALSRGLIPERHPTATERDRDRALFWERLAVEAGVGDLHAFCQIAGRLPVYDDVGRSIQIIKERGRA